MDTISIKTGCLAGFVTALEKKLKRKLHTIGRPLLQHELPFEAVLMSTDGTTRSPTIFTDSLWKVCENDYQKEFNTISGPLDNLYLTAGIM